jgi:hypothetical protein
MSPKETLIKLSNDIKFESVMFPKVFQYSNREPLRYYLWMIELTKWLYEIYNYHNFVITTNIKSEEFERLLIHGIEFLIKNNVEPIKK